MANPNNVLNQNLSIGGDLDVTGDFDLTGDALVTGGALVTGDILATGRIGSGDSFRLITPALSSLRLAYTEVLVTLSTTGATTAINFGAGELPEFALVTAVSIRVVTAITGVNSTVGTLNVNPTSGPSPAGTISAFTAGTAESGVFPTGIQIDSADADDGTFVLSGGADNTPTAGSVRITVYYWKTTPSTS